MTKKDLQQFLGLANYYRWFIPRFSTRAGALTDLIKGKVKGSQRLSWSPLAKAAFHDVRTVHCTNAMLYVRLPNHPFCLYMDDSDTGVGAVLTQDCPSWEQPIFYLSRKLPQTEQKYAVVEREALVIKWAIQSFHYYLWGRWFTMITDHAPLQWLNRMKDASPRLMWWYLALEPFTFQLVYCKGSLHSNADFFSRQAVWNKLDQHAGLEGGCL